MLSEADGPPSRVPTLVTYCQRVLSIHAEAISSLGDDIRYDVIKPVLECCSADTLLRLEQASPCIEKDTSDIWENLCCKTYPLFTEQLSSPTESALPESWRDQFFLFREKEARRLEEVASRLRNQRMEADERKKEREVKLTDRLPPPKRSRTGWSTASQPKSLFQKTKSEASKLKRSMYAPPMLPPMPQGKKFRILPGAASAKPPPPPSNIPSSSQVTVKTVTYHRPPTSFALSAPAPKSDPRPATPKKPVASSPVAVSNPKSPPLTSPPASDSRATKPPISAKKDPMASLFMPKHRALSQLPGQTSTTRSAPAR
ncbi:hypothetical protein BV22DRAFT_338913 [Leucogyrophana mollusca]|uniref:Uncharacterized protein n=1 Tax=Leucogyrophana mollusca TaxID=85980 RepID=A0ACB8BMC4_9AGAM|nr:hypothetical protein BV22DRAFT_338913 [Leucogyrophana mollusca]